LTGERIRELEQKALQAVGFADNHGSRRANDVSKEKHFKTTVHAKTRDKAISVLEVLCGILKK